MSSKDPIRARHAAITCGLALTLALAGLAGCAGTSASTQTNESAQTSTTTTVDGSSGDAQTTLAGEAVTLIDSESLFSTRDLDPSYDDAEATTIELAGTSATVSGEGATVDGSTVTITAEGTYVLTGTLTDGLVVVDVEDTEKVQIVLAGADITSSGPTALLVRNADKVFLTLAEGTENSLSATGAAETVDDHNVDGTVFSTSDLTINGTGTLGVTSAQGNGIVGKDELTLVSGTVSVTAQAGHAIQANDSVAVASGTWTLVAGTDGIHCENDDDFTLGYILIAGGTIDISAGSDGIDAGNVLQVDGGTISVQAADDGLHAEYDVVVNAGTIEVSRSYEALEGSTVTITGGTLDLVASDDGINASGDPDSTAGDMQADSTAYVLVTGGVTCIEAQGDGVDSNGDLTVTGGELYVSGPTSSANGSLDYAGTGTITGGTVIAAGASGMAQNFGSASTQGTILVSLSGSAGDTVTVTDEDGNVLASHVVTSAFDCVVVSAEGIVDGGTYTITAGSSTTAVTMSGLVYGESAGMGMGQMGGGMGQMGGAPGQMGGGGMGDMGGGMGGTPGQQG